MSERFFIAQQIFRWIYSNMGVLTVYYRKKPPFSLLYYLTFLQVDFWNMTGRKPKQRYEKHTCFKNYCDDKCGGRINESILVVYFVRRNDMLKSLCIFWEFYWCAFENGYARIKLSDYLQNWCYWYVSKIPPELPILKEKYWKQYKEILYLADNTLKKF